MEPKEEFNIEESKPFKDINEFIKNFETEIVNVPEIKPPKCLSMGVDEIKRKSPEELNEILFEGSRYALSVQMIINRNEAIKRWARSKLDDAQAHYIQQVSSSFGYNERPLIARHDPPLCKQLNELLRRLQAATDILHDVPVHIKNICDIVRDQKFLNIKRERNND